MVSLLHELLLVIEADTYACLVLHAHELGLS